MFNSSSPIDEFKAALLNNDRRKLMMLMKNPSIVITEDMITDVLNSKPVSTCLILIGGLYKKSGVQVLFDQACQGNFIWLDALVKKGMDLNQTYDGYDNFWELVIEHSKLAIAEHLIELGKAVKSNSSILAYPTEMAIRRNENKLLKLFLTNNANPNFAKDYIFLSLIEEARHKKNIEAEALLLQHGADEKYAHKVELAHKPYVVARRVNHTIGINQKNIYFNLPESKIILPLHNEALDRDSVIKMISKGLNAYIESKSPDISIGEVGILQQILDAYNYENEHIASGSGVFAELLSERLAEQKPIIIESGWPGHSVGIAIYKDKLIYCNRGLLKDPNYNIIVCQINDLSKITPEFLLFLRASDSPPFLFNTLKKVVNLDQPVLGIKVPDQTGGVCMTANTRSLIEGLLAVMISANDSDKLKRAKFIFDDFINFVYLKEITLLLSEFRSSKIDEERIFYYHIFKELLIQFPKNKETEKDQTDLMTFTFKELPDDFKEKLVNEIPSIINSFAKELTKTKGISF